MENLSRQFIFYLISANSDLTLYLSKHAIREGLADKANEN